MQLQSDFMTKDLATNTVRPAYVAHNFEHIIASMGLLFVEEYSTMAVQIGWKQVAVAISFVNHAWILLLIFSLGLLLPIVGLSSVIITTTTAGSIIDS